MAVAPLSHSARDYVRAFDLTWIALWRDGRLGVSRNPKGAEAAWWCPAKAAGALVRAANANGRMFGGVRSVDLSKTKVSGGLAPEPLTDDSSGSLAMLAAMRRASSLVSTRVTPCRIRRHDRRCLF
jgi:hypothetical protein